MGDLESRQIAGGANGRIEDLAHASGEDVRGERLLEEVASADGDVRVGAGVRVSGHTTTSETRLGRRQGSGQWICFTGFGKAASFPLSHPSRANGMTENPERSMPSEIVDPPTTKA
ncbi:MAG TPA: hypothetical protein VF395_08345 [Polyangiaceae bacterium]